MNSESSEGLAHGASNSSGGSCGGLAVGIASQDQIVTLAHGAGGQQSAELVSEVFLPCLAPYILEDGEDASVISLDGIESKRGSMSKTHESTECGSDSASRSFFRDFHSTKAASECSSNGSAGTVGSGIGADCGSLASAIGIASRPLVVSSIDGYVVSPIIFKGGNIGKLAICGSSNDVAMRGGRPYALNLSFILEEGLEIEVLQSIVATIADELKKGGLKLASLDTKVVPKGACDKVFIISSAMGALEFEGISAKNIEEGDIVIASGMIGSHGALIYTEREGMELQSALQSDCAQLYPMTSALLRSGVVVHAMRDATRGGVAALLNEWGKSSKVRIELDEAALKMHSEVSGICEILGLDPLSLANEGMCLFALPEADAPKALEILHATETGKDASIIGIVKREDSFNRNKRVVLKTRYGGKRYVPMPSGEILPRIC